MSYYNPAGYDPSGYNAAGSNSAGYNAAGYNPAAMAGARPRPGIVTAAAYMLFACGLLALGGAVTAFAAVGTVANNLSAASVIDPSDSTTGKSVMIVYGVISLLAMGLFLLCGFLVLRGRNGMRVMTWVFAGLGILCLGLGALSSAGNLAVGSSEFSSSSTDDQLVHAIPGWYSGTTATLESITVLMLILVIILLALPSSNAFFRKSSAFVMMPGYPGAYPGYPGTYPGYAAPATVYPAAAYPAAAYPPAAYPAYPQAAAPWMAQPGYVDPATGSQPGVPETPAAPAQPMPYADPLAFTPAPTLMDQTPPPPSPPPPSPEPPSSQHSAPPS